MQLTLDYIKPVEMKTLTGIDGAANVRSATNLKIGLKYLAEMMRDFEIEEAKKIGVDFRCVNRKKDKNFNPLISCIFHWYSVSLVNYLRFIAMIEYTQIHSLGIKDLLVKEHSDGIKAIFEGYVELIPEVKKFRNKISAHFAATYVQKDDEGMLKTSLHGFPEFNNGYFSMRQLQTIDDYELDWSVTKIHEELAPRLWPEHQLIELPV